MTRVVFIRDADGVKLARFVKPRQKAAPSRVALRQQKISTGKSLVALSGASYGNCEAIAA
jgi:hypothetical protein